MASETPHPEVVFTEGELLVIYIDLTISSQVTNHAKVGSLINSARAKILAKVSHSPVFQRYLSKGGI